MLFDFRYTAVAVVFIVGAVLFLKGQRKAVKKETSYKMRGYHIIYADSNCTAEEDVETGRLLYSEKFDIQGKPDFIFKNNFTGSFVPVEIKSGNIKDQKMPHQGDLMQLACYFAMVKEEYGENVPYGKIIYKDYMFEIKNTSALEKKLLKQTLRMRKMIETGKEKAKPQYIKCRHCVCAGTVCKHYKNGD